MSKEPPKSDCDQAFEDIGHLTSLAGDYFSREFPNPAMTGCPHPSDIENLIKTNRMPGAPLREHLFGCSNCFQLYRSKLAAREKKEIGLRPVWHQLLTVGREHRIVTAGVALAVLIVSGVVIVFLQVSRVQEPGPVASNNAAANSNPTRSLDLVQVSPTQGPKDLVAIDFDSKGLRRGLEKGEESHADVRRGPVSFSITLPPESPAGPYAVFVADAFGNKFGNTPAESRDGKTLTVEIDLSKLPHRKYRLCVSRAKESPNCQLLWLK
jgi:hypothetical protein